MTAQRNNKRGTTPTGDSFLGEVIEQMGASLRGFTPLVSKKHPGVVILMGSGQTFFKVVASTRSCNLTTTAEDQARDIFPGAKMFTLCDDEMGIHNFIEKHLQQNLMAS